MRTTLDFSPFWSAFDQFFTLIDDVRPAALANGPAYDVVRTGEDAVSISMAVPGFKQEDLEITSQPNLLIVSGKKSGAQADYLWRGIDTRPFTHRFTLADYVEVAGADLHDGVLTISLKRELPEELKPRRIAIGDMAEGQVRPEQRQIEGHKAA